MSNTNKKNSDKKLVLLKSEQKIKNPFFISEIKE